MSDDNRLARSFAAEWLRPSDPDSATSALVDTLSTVMLAFHAAAKARDARRGHHYGSPLTAEVIDGALRISIGVDVLAHAVSYADWANPFDEDKHDYIRTFAITNAEQFAKDVRCAMLAEREDGSSPLSDFLDKATEAAVDDGSEACEYEQSILHGENAACETWARGKTNA